VDKEKALIEKCQSGQVEAFEELILGYEKKAYNIAYKIVRNEQDAMDASQEAFIKVYKSIHNFKFQSSFSTWLYRIVMNAALDMQRKNKNKTLSLNEMYDDGKEKIELVDTNDTPEEYLERKISKEIVIKGIQQLEEDHKTAIILRDVEGFKYNEIAEILSCSTGTVKSRISRGRLKLKEWIKMQGIISKV